MGLIYLDHHATTPCDPAVLEEMWPWFGERFANPASRSHSLGLEARRATERARGQVAARVGASPKEIVFTSGATEANNLAILGVVRASKRPRPHVITVATEHKAVLDPVAALVRRGEAEATVLSVGTDGLLCLDDLRAALRPGTVLVSVMAVNNEIGVEQPLAAIGALCAEAGVRFHCDAAQSTYLPLDVEHLGVDLLSLSAHKMYGPKGVGALVVRRRRPRLALEPLLYGGGHERGLRSGTLPVPLLVGMGRAAELCGGSLAAEVPRLRALRDRLYAGLSEAGGVTVHGSMAHRCPQNLNLSFAGVESEALLLGVRGVVALSSGSACTSATLQPSHVLRALKVPGELAQGSLRFGLGRTTTEADVDAVIQAVVAKVKELRVLYEELGIGGASKVRT